VPSKELAMFWMDGKWSGVSFLLGASSLANHGGYLGCYFIFVVHFVRTSQNTSEALCHGSFCGNAMEHPLALLFCCWQLYIILPAISSSYKVTHPNTILVEVSLTSNFL
jgi:hypothetical protein